MEQKTIELLDSLGVTTLRSVRTDVESLSGGQRQAVAIARSMLGEPKLVLLDEPTAALGIVQTKQILDLIKRLKDNGLGVIVISHNLPTSSRSPTGSPCCGSGAWPASFEVCKSSQEEIVAAITGAEVGGAATEETTL